MEQTFDLTPYQVQRPEKVIWRIDPAELSTGDALSLIRSKSQVKFLRRIDEILVEHSITWEEKVLNKQEFLEWLPFYESHMQEMGYRILATEEWYDKRAELGKSVEGMFFYKDGKLISSGIFVVEGQEKATFAFKASDRLDLTNHSNSSIGSIIDYFFLKLMVERKIEIISAGKSRNAFGVHNTFGYLEYKLRFGYLPQIQEDVAYESTVPLAEDGSVLFFADHQGTFTLLYVHPKDQAKELAALRLIPDSIRIQEITY